MTAGSTKPLNTAQRAAIVVLVGFADGWRAQGRTDAQSKAYAALYWHTHQPSYAWARCGWHFSPATLRSLVRRGMAEFKLGYESGYFTRITTAGRQAHAAHVAAGNASAPT